MPAIFTLDVATEPAARRAVLRLRDAGGVFIAAHEVELGAHPAACWDGLFDTRRHVRSLEGVTPPADRLAALGRFLGEHVLGAEIARVLAGGVQQRTLLVRVPDDAGDVLGAAFARVPWEIALAPGDDRTLGSRNVVVRVAIEGAEPARQETSIAVGPSEPVRVLLVFADGPGERPLAARLEREELLELFFAEVMPSHNVEVDVLCHGVTRRRIEAQVQARAGYHVVHWSGHGNVNALRIALDEGESAAPQIGGEDLVGIFSRAGGFVPPVVFLGACHSGAMVRVTDWASLRASLGEDRGDRAVRDLPLDRVLEEQPGFTGTALSLVRAGVKQVVAMRYEVSDPYARRLAMEVYRRMFADRAHHAVDAAVALGREKLAKDEKREDGYQAVDHATPLVFGSEPVRLVPAGKRSAQIEKRAPKPQPLLPSGSRELDTPRGFVGREEELTRLRKEWLEANDRPIALIQGLAGLGKTSLAAEAVHLWFGRFDYVLAFQARGGALGIDEFYRRLDQRLVLASTAYRERCNADEMAKVWLPPGTAGLRGAEREEALRNNLIDVLGAERILLVVDNFETNLLTKPRADGAYACADPAWERLFEALAVRLERTGSRALVTSRHKPAALEGRSVWVPLGPLPMLEAVLFFQGQEPLCGLWYGDKAQRAVAERILYVSRGHPLILGRIADLARAYYDETHGLTLDGRQAIETALDKIKGAGYKALPDIFAGVKGVAQTQQERAYLSDVALGAVDVLIERLSPEARTLLWIVTRAGEPTEEDIIGAAWGAAPHRLLGELCTTGLLMRTGEGPSYAFHEIVAERVTVWMELHPDERHGHTEATVWQAYGALYALTFHSLLQSGNRGLATEAGGKAIRYLVRARAFEPLSQFASRLVNRAYDPALLRAAIADLQAAVGAVPAGKVRWRIQASLADALVMAGRPDQALPLYSLAAKEAEPSEHWSDMAWINQNWAGAFVLVDQFDRAREVLLRSSEAAQRAGRPTWEIVASEVEALRIDVMQGRAGTALPAIEKRLTPMRDWWARRANGETAVDARHDEMRARAFASGLDVARQANQRLERWQVCLDLLNEIEQVKHALGVSEHELARVRLNEYSPLMSLGRLTEAKMVLDDCLNVFRKAGDITMEALSLSSLAHVWSKLGDSRQAVVIERSALAIHERLSHPRSRAASHHNLANYLHTTGSPGEAGPHRLAALAYTRATGADLRDSLRDLALDIQQANARGERFDLPHLADILPAFAVLRTFLDERHIPVADLQTAIDDAVEEVQTSVAAEPMALLRNTLRDSGLDPTSASELRPTDEPHPWVILAKPLELLQQRFDLQRDVLILCSPGDVLQESDIQAVEKIFAEDPRIDDGFALVITGDPSAEERLTPNLPDDRRYLFMQGEAFQRSPDPQAFLLAILRDGLGRRRLFDFRLPAGEWQFFGREKELEALERDVLTGHSVGVFGPRKVGKTSLLRRMAEKLREGLPGAPRGIPVEVDLQATSYLRRNLAGVAELIGRALDRELKRAAIQTPALQSHPLERLREAVEHVEQTIGARVLLILDEYEVLLGGRIPRSDGVELLTWLRGLAQEHPKGFGLVLAGRNQKLLAPARIDGADNPMYRFLRSVPIAGLVPDDCRRMVRALGGRMGLRYESEALDLIVDETGGHPALVRTLGDLVDLQVPTSERNPAVVDEAVVTRVLPRFSRDVDEDMREFVNAANDIDARADDYLVHLAYGVPWIGGPAQARLDDALVGYGILEADTHEFRIGRLRTWLRENHGSPAKAAHG